MAQWDLESPLSRAPGAVAASDDHGMSQTGGHNGWAP